MFIQRVEEEGKKKKESNAASFSSIFQLPETWKKTAKGFKAKWWVEFLIKTRVMSYIIMKTHTNSLWWGWHVLTFWCFTGDLLAWCIFNRISWDDFHLISYRLLRNFWMMFLFEIFWTSRNSLNEHFFLFHPPSSFCMHLWISIFNHPLRVK